MSAASPSPSPRAAGGTTTARGRGTSPESSSKAPVVPVVSDPAGNCIGDVPMVCDAGAGAAAGGARPGSLLLLPRVLDAHVVGVLERIDERQHCAAPDFRLALSGHLALSDTFFIL